MEIDWEDFERVELRVGTIRSAVPFPEARKPAYKLEIFFGERIGMRHSSAQICNYALEQLPGMQVICVMNFPPKRIAGFPSEVLVLGLDRREGGITLLRPDEEVEDGLRVY